MKLISVLPAALLLAACGPGDESRPAEAPSPASIPDSRDATPQPASEPDAPEPDAPEPEVDAPEPSEQAAPQADTDAFLAALPAPYSQADLANGAREFRRCTTCHTLGEGGPNRVGPNLHGLFDRSAGEVATFNYSAALRDADFEWTPEHLDDWLADPRGYLPGNRMSFVGLRDPDARRDVIAYLMIESAR